MEWTALKSEWDRFELDLAVSPTKPPAMLGRCTPEKWFSPNSWNGFIPSSSAAAWSVTKAIYRKTFTPAATGLGTFIPPASTTGGNDSDSIVATIEYAVRVLRVGDIVVCGHSPCGAMGALLRGTLAGTGQPHLAWWLKRVAPIQDLVRARYARLIDDAERQHPAELESVLLSLENLPTHPCVQEPLNRGALHLHGWFFKTATGELFAYEPATGQFESLMAFGKGKPA